jgi:hypothetical protein
MRVREMKTPKLGKPQILLLMYELLLNKRYLTKSDTALFQKLPSITFKRYIYEIKDYLDENGSDYLLKYSRRYKAYRLLKKERVPTDLSPLLAIGSPRKSD